MRLAARLRLSRCPLVVLAVFASTVATACPADDAPKIEPDFPADYQDTYVEVRDCRGSGDHELNNIRILASPTALDAYLGRDQPFPEGAVVLKEEYEFGDLDCSGPIKQWTVMRRLPDDSAPDLLDWTWQQVDLEREVVDLDAPRCVGCHQACGVPPDGYEWTCAVP